MVGLDGFIFFSVVAGGWFGVSSSGAQTNTHTLFRSEWVKLSCQCQTVVRHLNHIFHGALKPLSNRRRGGGVADKGTVEYNDNILDTRGGQMGIEYSYEVEPRQLGGWRLKLLEDGDEVGGGAYCSDDETTDDDAYADALSDGQEWLATRQQLLERMR